jgi:IPT/TIG domain
MSLRRILAPSRAVRLGALAALLAASAVALGAPSEAATGALTPSTGGALAAPSLILAGTGFADSGGTSKVLPAGADTYGVSFAAGTCAPDAAAGHAARQIDVVSAAVLSPTRMAVDVPGAVNGTGGLVDTVSAGVESKKDYALCVYSATLTGSVYKLLVSARYTVYPVPTLAAHPADLSMTIGPASGGQTITVLGDTTAGSSATARGYFSARTAATLGGRSLLTLHVARDGNSFTAVTPPVPAGVVDLVVTTEGGSVTDDGAYTSATSITVSPAVVAPAGGTALTITGLGFQAIQDAPGFGVLLRGGQDDPISNPGTACTDVQVQSDTRLTCVSPALALRAYTVVVTDSSSDPQAATYANILTSGATVTAARY